MGLKAQVEDLCKRALSGEEVVFNLPNHPPHYNNKRIEDRFMQLVALIQRNGCTISKVNLTDYKITPAPKKPLDS
jgi:hypothetical protein